ncbi:MAG: hypothetical protein QME62_06900 [Armatimonadota bacterium]|nr:hypothetical protein [Armatimonadota bacterium]
MPQFMIEFMHTPDQCIKALDKLEPRATDLLDGVYWSCFSGNHASWVVVEASSEEAAREMIPEPLRNQAIITEVHMTFPEEDQAIDPEAARSMVQEPDLS